MVTISDLELMDVCVLDGHGDACIVVAIREDEVDFYRDGEGFTYRMDDLFYWLVGIQGKGGNKNFSPCYRNDHEPNADHKFVTVHDLAKVGCEEMFDHDLAAFGG